MIDFQKKIRDTDKFRQACIRFQNTGSYCLYPIGTTEYHAFWDEELRRCVDGYTAEDGDYITGYNYFYLNYCPIDRIVYEQRVDRKGVTKLVRVRKPEFPDFYDYDYFYFQAIQEAEEQGKHLCVLKSRRKGFSYKNASLACRNYYLIPNSKSYIYAADQAYLLGDGTFTKVNAYMSFIDKHTAFAKKRLISKTLHKKSGFLVKDEYGNETETGYLSEIIGVSIKDDPDKVRGKAGKLILFEEAGSCSELAAAWSIARPSVEQDGIAFGLMIAFGTGGDTKGTNFTTLKDMFYKPKGYNCLEFDNIWDEHAGNEKCGFFCPQYTNLANQDENGNRLYMDKDGNTNTKEALDYILGLRREVIQNATNSITVDRYVAENCICPAEACLQFNGNIFPKKQLQEQLSLIRTNKNLQNHKQVGQLDWDVDGNLHWIIKKTGDITHYPLDKDEDTTGSIVIWEHPNKEATSGLYIAGIDSYDYDQSGTNSLGSCFIYKRIQNLEQYSDIIVAEYTGRPPTAEEFYENVRKLLIYYNAKAMYENQNKGIFVYFTQKHCDYLLADQPDIINDVVGNSKVQRKKGCHMNKQIKQWGEGLIKDWLNDINANGKKNLYNILSEPLLEELISYNDLGNFDRCLLKDTKITTSTGFKNVQDISVGDLVLTDSGSSQKVTWVDKHIHKGNSVQLRLIGDYRTLWCTDNHPILVAYTDNKKHKFRKTALQNVKFLRADQLTYKYQFGLLPKRKLTCRLELDNELLYTLGWIMADGYCSPLSNGITIVFQKNQLACAERCKKAIEKFLADEKFYFCKNSAKLTRKETVIKDYGTYYRLIIHSKKLHDLVQHFGCIPNNKRINYSIYNSISSEQLIPFVIGYFEGDGHQRINVNYDGYSRDGVELSTVYEDLLLQVRQILIDVGIYSSIRKVKVREECRTQYSMLISGCYVNKLLQLYNSSKFIKVDITKNSSKVLENEQGFWCPIKLLDSKEINEEVYNFEVEEDHTYVANGITTHNCMALLQVMIYREQLYNVVVKEKEKINKQRLLFDGPIFAQYQSNTPKINFYNDNVYTF